MGELFLLLLVLAVLLALAIPRFSTLREKATQKSTMLDIEMWARAITGYETDHARAPTNPNGRLNYKKDIVKELLPYLETVRISDWWGFPLCVWTGRGIDQYGIITAEEREFIISSSGKRGVLERWEYDPHLPDEGLFELNEEGDFEKDLVFWKGKFIRGPWPKDHSRQTDR